MNYYAVLGVKPDATNREIKSAYRRLAKKHHPDTGGDVNKFREITEAYNALTDKSQKSVHTKHSRDFDEMFTDLNNAFYNRQQSEQGGFRKNKDLVIEIELDLEEILTDVEKTVSIKQFNGERKFVNVTIPAGTIHGNLKYKGLGDNHFSNVAPGNLLVKTSIRRHKDYTIDGIDLRSNVTISVWEAMLGTSVRLSTLCGKNIQVTIPPGTQHGTVFNIPGHGIPKYMNPDTIGKLLLNVLIKIPQNLTKHEITLIKDNFVNREI